MDEELVKEVKIRLRSLVVSSPTQMDSRMLMRDYFKMLGTHIPLTKMGYRDFVSFLRERCGDSFLLSGPQSNPILTVIVPESAKHIDNFVQKSKVPSTSKVRVKRRSIPESRVNPPKQDLINKPFVKCTPSVIEKPKEVEVESPAIITKNSCQNKENVNHHQNTTVTSNDVKNFLKKRLPIYNSLYNFEEALFEKRGTLSQENGNHHHISSSSNSTKALKFEELKSEIMELITAAPEGVWCTDLIRIYRERYNRELNFTRFGYTSIVSLAYALEAGVQITRLDDTGDWLLTPRGRAAPAPPALRVSRAGRAAPCGPRAEPDADDALPGVEFDPDVFPADCILFTEEIPSLPLAGLWGNESLLVKIGEVYSPSHFWFIRIGEDYSIAMDEMMDEMTRYYNAEGRERALARGAVRVGHYCAALYDNDWHRSLIVKIVDTDTVKVRHVDYGTVETVGVRGLRALRRRWAALPAQAVRARLACVRPGAAGRRWPHAACTHFLQLVNDAHFYANVVAIDPEQEVVETLLIDTRGDVDVSVGDALVRAGHADPRAGSALATAETYLYPRFDALEGGDTPSLGEIQAYLSDGIALDYVEAYRRHVPLSLEPESAPSPPHPAAPPPASPDSDDVTLHDFYVTTPLPPPSPPSPPSPPLPGPPRESSLERAELATRIPLLMPSVISGCLDAGKASATPCTVTELSPPAESPCSSSCSRPSPSPASTAPTPPSTPSSPAPPSPPAPTCPVPVAVQAQGSRPPLLTVQPFVNPQPAGNPNAQVFTPRHTFHPQPVVRPPYLRPECGPGPFPGPPPAWQWAAPLGGVPLGREEYATYRWLAQVHPDAAHWYMLGAMGRAVSCVRPPPGFGI